MNKIEQNNSNEYLIVKIIFNKYLNFTNVIFAIMLITSEIGQDSRYQIHL